MPKSLSPIAVLAALSQKNTLTQTDLARLNEVRLTLEEITDDMALAEVTLEELAASARMGDAEFSEIPEPDALETVAGSLNKLRHWVRDLMYFQDTPFPGGE